MDRIKLKSTDAKKAPKVLLMHGIQDTSVAWVDNSEDRAPAFKFARAGYDVWLGNNRGNMFSRNHINLKTKSREFWDFDFEDMGLHDVPAFIDTILNETGSQKIDAYVGHSEGTT